jgi:hypothetical protein
MKPAIFCLSFLALFGSCASSFKVLDKKPAAKPLSRMIIVYIDNPIEFSAFDSVTYNFGLKSCFADTDDFPIRSRAETRFSEKFFSFNTETYQSSEFFNARINRNSYDDFNRQMDSLNIDGIFVINLHRFDYERTISSGYHQVHGYTTPTPHRKAIKDTTYWENGPDELQESTGSIFTCYLIPRGHYLPVWKARFELNGAAWRSKTFANKISRQMTTVAEKLAEAGYIVRLK